jgi:hypothetical protein
MSAKSTEIPTETSIPLVEEQPEEVILDADKLEHNSELVGRLQGEVEVTASNAAVTDFTSMAGIQHRHGPYATDMGAREHKHDLRERWNVTDEAIINAGFVSESFDHAAVHELWMRRFQLREADYPVFNDVPNDDRSRWQKIGTFVRNNPAPIPEPVERNLTRIIFG